MDIFKGIAGRILYSKMFDANVVDKELVDLFNDAIKDSKR